MERSVRNRDRREPRHRPLDGCSPCAATPPRSSSSRGTARTWRALPETGEGRGREVAVDRQRSLPGPRPAKSVVDQALAAFGRIDGLLNIAGAVDQRLEG